MTYGAPARGMMPLLLFAAGCTGTPRPALRPHPVLIAAPASRRPRPKPAAARGPAKLVTDLEAAQTIPDRDERWQKEESLVEEIRRTADPRASDALARFLAKNSDWQRGGESVHFHTEAAFALAEIGDLRALPVLVARLGLDPKTTYVDGGPEAALRDNDDERADAARLIADLAALHPEALAKIRAEAERPLFRWLTAKPEPPDSGLRALVAIRSKLPAFLERIRAWADPPDPLPRRFQFALPGKWTDAGYALRVAGALRDEKSWPILSKQLGRRARAPVPIRRNGAVTQGLALRALGAGAADGFSEWGDPKAFDLLLRYVRRDKEDEQARLHACTAIAWLVDEQQAPELAKEISQLSRVRSKPAAFRLECLVRGLEGRRVEGLTSPLVDLLTAKVEPETVRAAARALGRAGFDATVEQTLEKMLGNPKLRVDAALALLLGGSPGAAQRAVEALPDELIKEQLAIYYRDSLSGISAEVLREGHLYRWVENALSVTGLERPPGIRYFATKSLEWALGALDIDTEPHTLTRVVLRRRLFEAARGGPASAKRSAVATLELMHEKGTLAALGAGSGKTAKRARAAAERLYWNEPPSP